MQITTGAAIWYHSGKVPVWIRWVLIKDEQPDREPSALLSTDVSMSAEQIIEYFVRRWSMEVTFREVREHMGVESQRQWSDRAIGCTTPSLMGLFSVVALWADSLFKNGQVKMESSAWYQKVRPTFSDALSAVRKQLWQERKYCMSDEKVEMVKIPKALYSEITELLARAA